MFEDSRVLLHAIAWWCESSLDKAFKTRVRAHLYVANIILGDKHLRVVDIGHLDSALN